MKTTFVNTDKKSYLGIKTECEWGHRGIGSDEKDHVHDMT